MTSLKDTSNSQENIIIFIHVKNRQKITVDTQARMRAVGSSQKSSRGWSVVHWQNLTMVSRESTKIFCRTCTFVWCINKCYCHDGGIKLLMWRKTQGIERQECPDSLLSALVLLTRNWYLNIFLLTPLSEANNCASPSNYVLKHAFQNYAGSCIYVTQRTSFCFTSM